MSRESTHSDRDAERPQAVTFIDGQNLFHAAKEAFGISYPSYDVRKLSKAVCEVEGWNLKQVRFYTGIPKADDDRHWNAFWSKKLLAMTRDGIEVYRRHLRYRQGVPEEKGIDVRIAIDLIRMAHRQAYDVAVIFSQDQDLTEATEEIKTIGKEQGRWIHLASAFPKSPSSENTRGINRIDWIPIDEATYRACSDPRDYRPD